MAGPFVDTGGWAAWANDRDVHHSVARAALSSVWELHGRLVTSNLVLIELSALFIRMKIAKSLQIGFFDDLAADESVHVVTVDRRIEADAWRLWRSRLDKDWTIVDCTSFVIMRDNGLSEALTADHHFEQAGFVRLLK